MVIPLLFQVKAGLFIYFRMNKIKINFIFILFNEIKKFKHKKKRKKEDTSNNK